MVYIQGYIKYEKIRSLIIITGIKIDLSSILIEIKNKNAVRSMRFCQRDD